MLLVRSSPLKYLTSPFLGPEKSSLGLFLLSHDHPQGITSPDGYCLRTLRLEFGVFLRTKSEAYEGKRRFLRKLGQRRINGKTGGSAAGKG